VKGDAVRAHSTQHYSDRKRQSQQKVVGLDTIILLRDDERAHPEDLTDEVFLLVWQIPLHHYSPIILYLGMDLLCFDHVGCNAFSV